MGRGDNSSAGLIAGVDIETTGLYWNKNHRLIQIAVVFPGKDAYFSDVAPEGEVVVEPEAMQVNGLSLETVMKGPPQSKVDDLLCKFLQKISSEAESIIPVGWNVGSFDLGFIQNELPRSAMFFSRRVIDLTSLGRFYELKTGKPYRELKTEMHAKAVSVLGRDERHNALYDAQAALIHLDMFKEMPF